MNDENDSVEIVIQPLAKRVIGGEKYSQLCQRKSKAEADKVKDSLQADGCKVSISRDNGFYVVWWAK